MHRIHVRDTRPCLLSLLALLAVSSPAWALANVPAAPPPSWIHDGARLLKPAELSELNKRKEQLEQQTGARLVVLTLTNADGESPKAIAVRTLNAWGAGRKSALLLVLMSPRELYLQPGTDLASVFDSATASSICSSVVAPRMRSGARAKAIREGLEAIAARIVSASDTRSPSTAAATSPPVSSQATPLPQRDPPRPFRRPPEPIAPKKSGSDVYDWLGWLGLLGGLGVGGWGLSRLLGKKCEKCGTRMEQSSETIEAPTTWSTGQGRHTYSCGSCGHSLYETYVISALAASTTTDTDYSSTGSSTFWSSSSDSSASDSSASDSWSSSSSDSSSSSSSDSSGGGGSDW